MLARESRKPCSIRPAAFRERLLTAPAAETSALTCRELSASSPGRSTASCGPPMALAQLRLPAVRRALNPYIHVRGGNGKNANAPAVKLS